MKAKMYWLTSSLIGLALLMGAIQKLHADEFYQGKTIRFVVGFAAGGGYDLAARIVGRHIGKHIPGNPTIVVENMTGAGSLIAGFGIAPTCCAKPLAIRPLGSTPVSLDGSALQPKAHPFAASWRTRD